MVNEVNEGVEVVNEVNEGIVDIVVDREQLKCGYADAAQVEYRRV